MDARSAANETPSRQALARGRVLVCGAGGLGSWVLEMLARDGVGLGACGGFIRVVDPDVFEESNLNRQLLATRETIGQGKALAAQQRISLVNGQVETQVAPQGLTGENALELMAGCTVAVDATDNVAARLALEEAAEASGITLVHGSVGGPYGQVAVVRPGDGLLRKLYQQAAPPSRPTTANAVAAVASLMAQACCSLLCGAGGEDPIPSNALLTLNLHDLRQPCRLIRL